MDQPVSKSNSRLNFSIAGLMAITFVVALHVAFPVLVEVFLSTLYCGIFLLVFFYLPACLAIAFTSETRNGSLDVDGNPNSKRLNLFFAVLMILLYILWCVIVPVAKMMTV